MYLYYMIGFGAIAGAFYIGINHYLYKSPALLGTFLLSSGMKILNVIDKKFQLTYWRNGYTKAQNIRLIQLLQSRLNIRLVENQEDYLFFRYGRRWWGSSYKVHLFAGDGQIALNVDMTADGDVGLLDFGDSARWEQKILDILYELSEES